MEFISLVKRNSWAELHKTIVEIVIRHILWLSLDLSYENRKICHFYFTEISCYGCYDTFMLSTPFWDIVEHAFI